MSENKTFDILYGTGNLKFDKVKSGILQRRAELIKQGYRCDWADILDLDEKLDVLELRDRGYYWIREPLVVTDFRRDGLNFLVRIYHKTQRASLYGDTWVTPTGLEIARKTLENIKEITGIPLFLKKFGEHPAD